MVLEQANPTLDKFAQRLVLAGAGSQGPILSGLAGRFTLSFLEDETLQGWRVYTPSGFNRSLPNNQSTDGGSVSTTLVFGTDTASTPGGIRNFLEWTTDRGVQTRQFWVKNAPTEGGLYVNNQECQKGEAIVFVNIGDVNKWAERVSLAINILPTFNDEFFTQQEYSGNRYANTRRNVGGVETAQVFINNEEVVSERPVENVMGYFWEPPLYGLYTIRVRLRAKKLSTTYVDLFGTIRVRQIPCPEA